VKNAVQAPARIEQLSQTINELQHQVTTAITRTRATWGTIDRPIWESDAMGLCVHANAYFLQRVGRQPLDILGDSWRSLIHQDDRAMVYREWDEAIKQKRDFDLKYRWIGRDGEVIHIHAQTTRLLTPNGTITGWVAFVQELKP
jgi:PAS domain S-box-containing protein